MLIRVGEGEDKQASEVLKTSEAYALVCNTNADRSTSVDVSRSWSCCYLNFFIRCAFSCRNKAFKTSLQIAIPGIATNLITLQGA